MRFFPQRAARHTLLAVPLLAAVLPALAQQRVLQPLAEKPGPAPAALHTGAAFYVPATPETILWGYLPDASSKPILTVPSSSIVTFDTLSHEGLLEDQGRDPVKFFGQFGVSPAEVLRDAQAIPLPLSNTILRRTAPTSSSVRWKSREPSRATC